MVDAKNIGATLLVLRQRRNGHDAALWSVITPLSEWSVANRSASIDVPDFTCGSWRTNGPVDPNLPEGGNTPVRIIAPREQRREAVSPSDPGFGEGIFSEEDRR
jgi:hypothetical protein